MNTNHLAIGKEETMDTGDLTVTPAYGRDYRTKAAILAAWAEGADFLVAGRYSGTYANLRDADRHNLTVWGRYNSLRDKVLLRTKK